MQSRQLEEVVISSNQGQALELLLEIPDNLNFRLYSRMQRHEKTATLVRFLNEFNIFFDFDTVDESGDWISELDGIFLESLEDTPERDVLIAYLNNHPQGVQGFAFSRDREEVYAEGIFVHPISRGMHLSRIIRDVLVSHLLGRKVERLYIGWGGGYADPIHDEENAQALARRDIQKNRQAIVGLREENGVILSYGLILRLYRTIYDTARAVTHL